MNGSQSSAYQQMAAQNTQQLTGAAPIPLLDILNDRLGVLHKITSEIHDLADRVVGIRDNAVPQVAKSVPNGLLEEIVESANNLQDRLTALHERLLRV